MSKYLKKSPEQGVAELENAKRFSCYKSEVGERLNVLEKHICSVIKEIWTSCAEQVFAYESKRMHQFLELLIPHSSRNTLESLICYLQVNTNWNRTIQEWTETQRIALQQSDRYESDIESLLSIISIISVSDIINNSFSDEQHNACKRFCEIACDRISPKNDPVGRLIRDIANHESPTYLNAYIKNAKTMLKVLHNPNEYLSSGIISSLLEERMSTILIDPKTIERMLTMRSPQKTQTIYRTMLMFATSENLDEWYEYFGIAPRMNCKADEMLKRIVEKGHFREYFEKAAPIHAEDDLRNAWKVVIDALKDHEADRYFIETRKDKHGQIRDVKVSKHFAGLNALRDFVAEATAEPETSADKKPPTRKQSNELIFADKKSVLRWASVQSVTYDKMREAGHINTRQITNRIVAAEFYCRLEEDLSNILCNEANPYKAGGSAHKELPWCWLMYCKKNGLMNMVLDCRLRNIMEDVLKTPSEETDIYGEAKLRDALKPYGFMHRLVYGSCADNVLLYITQNLCLDMFLETFDIDIDLQENASKVFWEWLRKEMIKITKLSWQEFNVQEYNVTNPMCKTDSRSRN